MYTTIASFILVLALMFGGTGAAALAAQDSLPNQALYQVKTFTEDLALRSMLRNTYRLQMELDFADRRISEMNRLQERQQAIPEATRQRLENHLDQALLLATNFEDAEMVRALNQIRERLRNQVGMLNADPDQERQMVMIQEMIQTRIGWAEFGIDEPNEFRQQAQVRSQFNHQVQFEGQYGPGPGPDPDPEPGMGAFGPGPQEPGSENGECQSENCDPNAEHRYGPGPEAQEQNQNGPGSAESPGEGSSNPDPGQPPPAEENNGPGPGSNPDQDSGNENQGPDSSPGSGSNKGNGGHP